MTNFHKNMLVKFTGQKSTGRIVSINQEEGIQVLFNGEQFPVYCAAEKLEVA